MSRPGETIPSWFLFGSDDRNIPAAAHRFMAERAGSRRTVELAGGSHTVAIPEAATAIDLILDAAAAPVDADVVRDDGSLRACSAEVRAHATAAGPERRTGVPRWTQTRSPGARQPVPVPRDDGPPAGSHR